MSKIVTIWMPPDTLANRPAASEAGRMFFGTDTLTWYYDNGVTWEDSESIPIDDSVTLAKIATKTDTNSGVLGYDQNGNPVEIEEGIIGQVLITQAGFGPPGFGQVGSSGIAANAVGTTQITNGAVTAPKLAGWTHSQLEGLTPDAGAIFASLQTDQVAALTDVAAASGQLVPIELATGEWRRVDMADLLLSASNLSDLASAATARTNLGIAPISGAGAPGVSTGNGRILGTIYIDTTADLGYTLVDATTDANVWSAGGGGTTILVGTVDPTTEGVEGDFYYNKTDTERSYWYKDAGGWEQVGVVADDVTIEVDPTNGLQLKGFPAAATNTSPRKTAGGAVEWVSLGGSEVNDLETTCTGILDNQVPVGVSLGVAQYYTLPTGGAVAFNGTAFSQANATDTLIANTDDRIVGRVSAGAGAAEELTGTQVTAMLDNFSTSTTTKGLVPGSNGAAATVFLNATGTWTTPAGGGNVSNTGTPLITQYARWTDATTLEGRTLAQTKTDLSVGVANTIETSGTDVSISATAPTAAGQALVTTSATAAAWKATPTLSRSITIEDPGTAEDITMFFTPVAITITDIRSLTIGGTSTVNFDLYESAFATRATTTAINGSSMTADTNGNTDTTFTNAGVAANSWVSLKTTTGGTAGATELHVTVVYTED